MVVVDPPLEGAILGVVWPIGKHWESVLRRFMQQKINNGNSGTSGGPLQCSKLVDVTLYCPIVINPPLPAMPKSRPQLETE